MTEGACAASAPRKNSSTNLTNPTNAFAKFVRFVVQKRRPPPHRRATTAPLIRPPTDIDRSPTANEPFRTAPQQRSHRKLTVNNGPRDTRTRRPTPLRPRNLLSPSHNPNPNDIKDRAACGVTQRNGALQAGVNPVAWRTRREGFLDFAWFSAIVAR